MGRSFYYHVMVDIGGRQSPLSINHAVCTERGASFIPSSCDMYQALLPVLPLIFSHVSVWESSMCIIIIHIMQRGARMLGSFGPRLLM